MATFVGAVKCDWFPSFDAVERGRSSGGGRGVVKGKAPVSTGDDAAHRDGLVAAGDSVKRSRDYRTSSRSNITISAVGGAGTSMSRSSTPLLRLLMSGRTSSITITLLLPSPSTCLCLIVAASSRSACP